MDHNQKNSIIVNNTLGLSNVNGNYEAEKSSRRTLVLSSGDVERMAVESSRARLMMDLVKNPDDLSREFGFYYRGRRNDNNPAHFMTPHTATLPVPKRVIPTYPSLVQNLRSGPSAETYSEDFQTETAEEKKFHCWCNQCKMKRCRARQYPEENRDCAVRDNIMQLENTRGFAFRDNIMRFTDNSTMTPKLTDAYCEAYHPINRAPKTSEVYISTSDMDIRERIQKQISSSYPPPILKKRECDTCCYQSYGNQNKSRVTVVHDEVGRETSKHNNYDKLIDSIPKRKFIDTHSCPANRDNFVDNKSGRKNLYNEGISDSIAENTIPQFVGCPMRMQPSIKSPVRKEFGRFHSPIRPSTKMKYSQVTDKCIGEREPGIPFAHRKHSKYHYDCKEPVKRVNFRYEDDCTRHGVVASSRIPRPTQASRVLFCDRTFCKLPKKLLTSERDIDPLVGSKRMNMRI